jgi:catechol 2,3-dioxygenase-like lactoylglutathione lyase family enzyme
MGLVTFFLVVDQPDAGRARVMLSQPHAPRRAIRRVKRRREIVGTVMLRAPSIRETQRQYTKLLRARGAQRISANAYAVDTILRLDSPARAIVQWRQEVDAMEQTHATILGIDHVQLAAPPGCEAAARAFYGALLGLTEQPKPASLAARGGVWFAAGAQALHIGVEQPFQPARKAHPALLVRGLDALVARLIAADHAVTWDDALPGVRRCYVTDPWNNRLELIAAD